MSEKEETVEVTIKVPKSLIELLEAENFFGFERDYFFEASIRSLVGCYEMELDRQDLDKFYEKHGKNVAVYYVPKTWQDC